MSTNLGLQNVKISFETKVDRFIKRSEKGIVLLLLKHDTGGKSFIYHDLTDLGRIEPSDFTWSVNAKKYLKLALKGAPNKVIALAIANNSLSDVLDRDLKFTRFNYGAYPEASSEEIETIANWVKKVRKSGSESANATCRFILSNTKPNEKGVIDFAMRQVIENDITYTGQEYTARIAGILAGLTNRSITSYPMLDIKKDATGALMPQTQGEHETARDMTPEEAINQGKLILFFDGAKWKFGRGVNTYCDIPSGISKDLAKIKVVEAMDTITEDIARTFVDEYQGQVENTRDNRQGFCTMVTHKYFKGLEDSVLNGDFNNICEIDLRAVCEYASEQGADVSKMSDSDLLNYNTGSRLFVRANISILDTIEDLDMTISI